MFDGLGEIANWQLTNWDGVEILRIDFDGDADPGSDSHVGWDMAIQLEDLSGTLSSANFLIV